MHTFKPTLEYEALFLDFLFKSVPSQYKNEYKFYLIEKKVRSLDVLIGYSIQPSSWLDSDYCKDLLFDIEKYKFRTLPIERLLLRVKNQKIRRFLILLKRIKNKLLRMLSKM